MKKGIVIIIIFILFSTNLVNSQDQSIKVENFSLHQNVNGTGYILSVQVTTTVDIYSVNVTVQGTMYSMNQDIAKNNYYVILPTDSLGNEIELLILTKSGLMSFYLPIRSQTIDIPYILETIMFLLILIILVTKFALFYKLRN